jgi:ribosomal protein S27AE
MEKYAVVLDDEKTKTAEKDNSNKCPKCGKELHFDPHRNAPWCADCGTEPFEKKAE